MVNQNILLDNEICTWVLLPVVFIILCVAMLRHYVTIAIKSATPVDVRKQARQNVVAYARMLQAHAAYLPYSAVKTRVTGMTGKDGILSQPIENTQMSDAMAQMSGPGMMKNQLMMIVPQMAMMSIISSVFGGFVMAKFPFALSARFKGMTQRGVDIDHLDAAYATSMSMYFIIQFGINGILQLLLGSSEGDDMAMMKAQTGGGMPGQQPPIDGKVFEQCAQDLHLAQASHEYTLQNACALLLQGR
jgi:hypothetical protein